MRVQLFLILFFNAIVGLTQIPTNGLIAYYPFNGNAQDAVGTNHGTVNGAVLGTDRFGVANKSYLFNGISNSITINHNAIFNFSNYTTSVWFKFGGPGTAGRVYWTLLSKNNTGSGYLDALHLWVYNGTRYAGGRIGSGGSTEYHYTGAPSVDDGNWHQSITVCDNIHDVILQYLDGVLISSTAFTTNPVNNTSNIQIGYWPGYSNYFKGNIDDIRFYNRALGSEEIGALFLAENPTGNYVFMNIQALHQGYHLAGGIMRNVLYTQGVETIPGNHTDSVTIELHQASTPYNMVYCYHAIWLSNGDISFGYPGILQSGNYYIVVNHRNALETWSANPIVLNSTSGGSYSFVNGQANAYGANQVNVAPGKWAFYAGDLNNDLNIDLLELVQMEFDISEFMNGYASTDLNGDGNVDLFDLQLLEGNIYNFVTGFTP